MSKLKISPNLFLEVNELQRFGKFLIDDGWKRVLKTFLKNFGIVENETNSYFKVIAGANNSTVIINAGIAFDSNLDAIVLSENLELTVTNTNTNRWIVASRAVTNEESGVVSIKSDGTLIGINTEFTKVLRGQPNFPTKVKFNSTSNAGEYEVVSVKSDTSALLSGSFVNQSGMKYSVIGTFTPGFQPSEDDKMIYEYDSCSIEIIDSISRPSVSVDEFILAKVSFDNVTGAMSISDQRMRHMFNSVYTQTDTDEDFSNNNSTDPLASLLAVGIVEGTSCKSIAADVELTLEHGYTVSKYELNITSVSNIFNIISGNCNFLGTGDIPDGLFNNWLLVNRYNMKYAIINANINKMLYFSSFDDSIISDVKNEFIIVPNCRAIEYEISVSNNVQQPSAPFYFRTPIENVYTRARLYSYFPSQNVDFSNRVTVTAKYRLIDDEHKFPFRNLCIAQFNNIAGQSETLSKSSFTIDLANIEPQEKIRNYS